VLFQLDRRIKVSNAEDLAEVLTRQFVRRAKGGIVTTAFDQDHRMPVSPRWRRALERTQDPLSAAVFRMHFGDNRPLKEVAQRTGADAIMVEAARAGLREVVRRSAKADGVPLDRWAPERVDQLLVRLAAWSPGPCPPLLDIIEGAHPSHVAGCARCDRTVRLIRANKLTVEDLVAPTLGARPTGSARVLALHFHPDARNHRAAIRAELDTPSFPIGDDILLVDADQMDAIGPVIHLAAELAKPCRSQIRGAIVEGEGRWSPFGILGPMAERAEREARYRTWGQVDSLGELPPALPEPPSARSAWAMVLMLAAAAMLVLQLAWSPIASGSATGLDVQFTPGRGGVWTAFDVPETSLVHLVHLDAEGKLTMVLGSTTAADKAELAVGDGSYRRFTEGPAVLLAATTGFVPVDTLLTEAAEADAPLDWLAQRIVELDETADVRVHTP
jgi:hypothetical protein